MRFHLEILQEVCEAYAQAAAQWGYNYKKCALLEDAALSFVLNYVPANDAQRFSQGLYYLQDKGEKFKRACTTRDGHNYYRALMSATPADFLLSGSCVDIACGARCGGPRARLAFGRLLQNLCRAKTSNLQNLCSHTRERKRLSA